MCISCLCLICHVADTQTKKPQFSPHQKKPPNHWGRDLAHSRWRYPAMEQIMVPTFKILHWLLRTTGNSIISNSRHHLSIQQTSMKPYEVAQLKLNCVDKQLLKEATFLVRSLWLSLSELLPVLSHTNPSQSQLQQSTARRAPLLLSGLISSFKWVRDAETSFIRQPQAYFSCRTPAEAAAAPCQQLLLRKGSQLLWELPCHNTCKSLSTPQLRGFLLSTNHRTGWSIR